jgi:iron complex outermembrane recepter protein
VEEAEPVEDEITVTAGAVATPASEEPAAVTVVPAEEIEATGAVTLDDALRQVPGFTLFRRTGSATANPTTLGASLRGVGGSAASRALVLADGVPLGDPFGGWVAWGRVPRAAIERVEVVRGGASDLYGSSALAGVVHLLRFDPQGPADEPAWRLTASAGERETATASAWVGAVAEPFDWSVSADLLSTEGSVPVAPDERGAVDTPAGVEHGAAEVTLGWRPGGADEVGGGGTRLFLRAAWFDEERTNGTRLQENVTRIGHLTLGADGDSWSGRLWAAEHDFEQTFTAVADDRDSERLVRAQEVPARDLGLSLRSSWALQEDAHRLTAGLDLRSVRGTSHETVFLPSGSEIGVDAGGEQLLAGAWLEDLLRLGDRWTARLALRHDRWENEDRSGRAREESAWSPRVGVAFRAASTSKGAWTLTGTAYRSFRAPTLNELYRGFRVGDVVTDPNPALGPERLTGAELGARWVSARSSGWTARATLFHMELDDAVTNVTTEVTPELILRQRENVGTSRSRGVEIEAEGAVGRLAGTPVEVAIGYLGTDAEVTEDERAGLEGLRIAQVPEHQGSLRLGWTAPPPAGVRIDLRARYLGDAFDDDRNLFRLGDATVVDLRLARPAGPAVEVFVAAENLLDETYAAGRTPVTTLGPPRLVRLGVTVSR